MYKSAIRAAPRCVARPRSLLTTSRRLLSTAPPAQKSRSWKSSATRWALAAGAVYYYNTSNVFAEEPEGAIRRLDDSIHNVQESTQPTIDAIIEEKRQRHAQAVEERKKEAAAQKALAQGEESEGEVEGEESEGGLEGLEQEAGQEGAFNPETGEINFDCPCLGGMAHGPCGEEFKAAFSCFVYSNEEPKGVECIEKFKGMQDCFRLHPEVYASELEDDDEENYENEPLPQDDSQEPGNTGQPTDSKVTDKPEDTTPKPEKSDSVLKSVSTNEEAKSIEPAKPTSSPVDGNGSDQEEEKLVPRAAFDAAK